MKTADKAPAGGALTGVSSEAGAGASSNAAGTASSNAAGTASSNVTGGATGTATGRRVCPACGQADALNSQFCIFCGGAIPATLNTSSVHMQSELSNLRSNIAAVKSDKQGGRKGLPASFLLPVWIVLGLAAGAGSALAWQSKLPPPAMQLPERGLTVLTAKPYSDVFITYPDKRHFLIGRTGAGGDLSLADVLPGDYTVEASINGKDVETATAEVKGDAAGVAGGPGGSKMLSSGDAPAAKD